MPDKTSAIYAEAFRLEAELAREKARADAAVAEIVNEQRRFGEVQHEAWNLEEALAAARREAKGLRKALIALDGLRDHKGDCAFVSDYGTVCNCGFDGVQEKVRAALAAHGDGEEG